MDGKPIELFRQRSWNFRIPGDGHDVEWWLAFIQTLRSVGYDGVLSIEQEDMELDFESAAELRDQLVELKKQLNEMTSGL